MKCVAKVSAAVGFWLVCVACAASPQAQASSNRLWQIGKSDDSTAEFGANPAAIAPAFTLPADWATRTDWSAFPGGLHGDTRPVLDVSYDLPAVPQHGVVLSFKLLNAPKSGAQLGVFSNHVMAGLIQLWGTAGTQSPFAWKKTYRLYIPKEMLVAGRNVLRLETVRPMWSDASVDRNIWWEWDFLRLEAPNAPVREPIHGTVAYLGTTLRQSSGSFAINEDTVRLAPYAFKWLGIAYSGNTIRCDFWFDVGSQQPGRLDYLRQLRDLNLTAMVDFVSGSHFHNDGKGKMRADVEEDMQRFFNHYGSMFQFYELGNEPCMFGGGLAETLEAGRIVNQLKAATVTVVAPGWAYGGGKGTPINWDADPLNRARVEALCQATNGHSYGYSYADDRGGSFVETLRTFGPIDDGWPVEYINSETGTNDWHSEENGPHFASTQPHAQAFDRILRAHLAVVDRTMQHAAVFDDFGMFKPLASPADPTSLTVLPGVNGEDSRLKTYRRLALAYATHGAPLPWTLLNADAVADRKLYVRCVDTAAIPVLPGSEGSSNKILIDLVNFENSPQPCRVRVTLPAKGTYAGERFGPGTTYTASHREVKLDAGPTLDMAEELGPGEAVQYILTPPGLAAPYPPTNLQVTSGKGRLDISWTASSGTLAYLVERTTPTKGGPPNVPFKTLEIVSDKTTCYDDNVPDGSSCSYRVLAINDAGRGFSEVVTGVAGLPPAPTGLKAIPGDRRITLDWQPVSGAQKYSVARSGGGVKPCVNDFQEGTHFEDTDVTNDSTYIYAVTAFNEFGGSQRYAVVKAVPESAPAAPVELAAIAGESRVVLTWKPVAGALDYIVSRSRGADPALTMIARDVAENSYVDNDVVNGATYHYAVAAAKRVAISPDSGSVAATPADHPLPAPWKQDAIGMDGRRGSGSFAPDGNVYTVVGMGEDVWGIRDSGSFVDQPFAGDGQIVAHVIHCDNTDEWAKIGVMVRQSLAVDSPMAMLAFQQTKGCGLTYRAKAGGACEMVGGDGERWLKLVRKGDNAEAFISADGVTWRPRGSAHVALGDHALIGLFVCSHHKDAPNRAMFDHVEASPAQ